MEINYSALAPEIVLTVAGVLLMLAVPFTPRENQHRLGYLALAGIGLAVVPVLLVWDRTGMAFFDTVFQDSFGHFCKLLFLFATAGVTLVSIPYLKQEELPYGEFFALLLFSTVGMSLMATSADLILTFLGLEILSIATYVLAGYKPRDVGSTESAWKYFILGGFSTAFLLYGIALLYGATASTKYLAIAEAIGSSEDHSTLLIGLSLIVVGFGFKAAVVPFHVWTPDVYQGAPVPITAHLAVASKAAAFVAFVRVLFQVLPDLSSQWQAVLWTSAVLTMLLGNIAALTQTNIKRMLAYSSIAHAGYLLIAVTAHNTLSTQSILFYLVAYALMSLGAFTVVQVFANRDERYVNLEDYAGIGFRYPFVGISLSVFMVSLAGIPTTAGFMGKLFLFSAAVESQMYWLVVLGVVASAIGVYYYIRVIVLMYMYEPQGEGVAVRVPLAARIAIVVMVAGTFYLGLYPGPFLQLAGRAAIF